MIVRLYHIKSIEKLAEVDKHQDWLDAESYYIVKGTNLVTSIQLVN